ncbi:MAG: threonine--tRNA ligase [Pseudomonadota bacterium]|nr:threonine--tRNA ligase [Pseudomonadota bacterium]
MNIFEQLKAQDKKVAKQAIAARCNGELVDLHRELDGEITPIFAQDVEGLDIIRHSTAHLLAMAVKELYPEVQITIGPVIEEGFYYDFAFSDETKLTPEDFPAIEKKMKQLVKKSLPIRREEIARDDAIQYFDSIGEHYKAEIIRDIPAGETLTLYDQGGFKDLCRGPHVPSTAKLGAFKLMKSAGAYWRGDSNNPMLQRIYGTAWSTQEELEKHLKQLEEREKRNHKRIGEQSDLFHFQSEAPGMVFWHPNGWYAYQAMIRYIRDYYIKHGYQEINTPMLIDCKLWEQSGHWDKFQENMFGVESDKRHYAIKPMNCPGHIQVFNDHLRSYRDLPYRLAEFGTCHRYEPSGTLQGLMRLRAFVQDDGHIFCTEEQIQSEVLAFIEHALMIYKHFGFDDVMIRLSTRPEKRVGSDDIWDHSESVLEQILNDSGLEWQLAPGEGAFYGPKLEFNLKDSLGRIWQCGTVQLDFSMPERLGASYVNQEGNKVVPVMLHRAILGSLERFFGIVIENTGGWLPLWMTPLQVVVSGITDKHLDYAQAVQNELADAGVRSRVDSRSEKIGYKIREHTLSRVPFMVIIGDNEVEHNTISVRGGQGEKHDSISVETLISMIKEG